MTSAIPIANQYLIIEYFKITKFKQDLSKITELYAKPQKDLTIL
jgi:hypothetical protein